MESKLPRRPSDIKGLVHIQLVYDMYDDDGGGGGPINP
jgi:hypothetical protein